MMLTCSRGRLIDAATACCCCLLLLQASVRLSAALNAHWRGQESVHWSVQVGGFTILPRGTKTQHFSGQWLRCCLHHKLTHTTPNADDSAGLLCLELATHLWVLNTSAKQLHVRVNTVGSLSTSGCMCCAVARLCLQASVRWNAALSVRLNAQANVRLNAAQSGQWSAQGSAR
jgi:hypothetical protein